MMLPLIVLFLLVCDSTCSRPRRHGGTPPRYAVQHVHSSALSNKSNQSEPCPLLGLDLRSNLSVDLEYRGDESTWTYLHTLTEGNATTNEFYSEEDQVQFRLIQREHGGGQCNCWSVVQFLLNNDTNVTRCNSTSTPLCDGSASIPRTVVYSPLAAGTQGLSGMSIDEPSDTVNCALREKVNTTAYCNPPQQMLPFIKLEFILGFVFKQNSTSEVTCNRPVHANEGIEVAIRSLDNGTLSEWIPLAYFIYNFDNSGRAHINTINITDYTVMRADETIDIRGYTVPLTKYEKEKINTIEVCDSHILQSTSFQFRWLQTCYVQAQGNTLIDRWYIDDVQITFHDNDFYHECLYDDFNDNLQLNMMSWEYPRNGFVLNDQECIPAERQNVLHFGTQNTTGVSSRIVRTRPLQCNASSTIKIEPSSSLALHYLSTTHHPKFSTPISFSPSASNLWSSQSEPSLSIQSSLPILSPSFSFGTLSQFPSPSPPSDPFLPTNENETNATSDPLTALKELNDILLMHQTVNPVDIVVHLNEIWDSVKNDVNQVMAQLFFEVCSSFIAFARDSPFNSTGLAASSLLLLLDRYALDIAIAVENITALKTDLLFLEIYRNSTAIELNDHSIHLPPEVFPDGTVTVHTASFLFENLTVLPTNNSGQGDKSSLELISPVFSATLQCEPQKCNTERLAEPVIITFKHSPAMKEQSESGDFYCAFWKFENQFGPLVNGQWSTEECSKNANSSADVTVCTCNHLTHFGILLSPTGSQELPGIDIITTVGVTISLICLAATAISLAFLKSLRDMRNYIHINLCISLIIAQLIFIVAIDKTDNKVGCQVVAVLLHYFFLVSFMWMLMEGVVLYVCLVRVFVKHQQQRYIIAFSITSYGLPLLYMGLCIPLGFLLWKDGRVGYGYEEACWLRHDTYFIWSFIAPVIVIIICNIGFLIMTTTIICQHKMKRREKVHAKYWVMVIVSLVLVMGLTWIVGVLQFHEILKIAIGYLFAVFIGLQGVMIFSFFVPLSKKVRESYTEWWRSSVSKSEFLSKHLGDKILTNSRSVSKKSDTHDTAYCSTESKSEVVKCAQAGDSPQSRVSEHTDD